MNEERMGGGALVVGALAFIVTMALHPTGHDLVAPGQFESMSRLAVGAHALALASLALSCFGTLVLTRRLAAPLGLGALVVYFFGALAGMTAAVQSGFVAPELVGELLGAEPPAREFWDRLLEYSHVLNQAFARVFVVGASAAIAMWSAAILGRPGFARWIVIYGLCVGPLTILALLSRHVRLDVHGFGLIVLAQAVWFLAVGIGLMRLPAETRA